jgi:alpha-D-xyloside xylohydrolase
LAAPLPFGLYSDAYDHRDYVRAIATSGFGGILWCPEVRDMGSLEELYRRLQTSVFSAVTQVDCWYLKNPVWKQINKELNNSGRFMDHWERTEAACRKLLQMRMRLLPYLYSAFGEYHDTGVPPVRALVMDYPDDPATWTVDDQYMLGPSLMVAPLFTGQKKRMVYLPEGDWYDFWTQRKYAGGRRIEVEKPVDEIPVFVKGDSLLPLAEPVEFVAPRTQFDLTIGVYGAKPRKYFLYEDDGVTFDFEKGQQNRIELKWDGQAGATSKTGDYGGPSRYKIIGWKRVTADP